MREFYSIPEWSLFDLSIERLIARVEEVMEKYEEISFRAIHCPSTAELTPANQPAHQSS